MKNPFRATRNPIQAIKNQELAAMKNPFRATKNPIRAIKNQELIRNNN